MRNAVATADHFTTRIRNDFLQGIYTADDVVKILKESFSHVSEQWVQSHEDHSSATVATISKVPSFRSVFHMFSPRHFRRHLAFAKMSHRSHRRLLSCTPQSTALKRWVSAAAAAAAARASQRLLKWPRKYRHSLRRWKNSRRRRNRRCELLMFLCLQFSRAPPVSICAGPESCRASGVGGVGANAAFDARGGHGTEGAAAS
jgi:hypothetical protein